MFVPLPQIKHQARYVTPPPNCIRTVRVVDTVGVESQPQKGVPNGQRKAKYPRYVSNFSNSTYK